MKSYTIDTAAAWAGTIQTWQDGDIFRESNADLVADAIADRLGYLKTQVDAKVSTSSAVVWTGFHQFIPSAVPGTAPASIAVYRNLRFVDNATSPTEAAVSGIEPRIIKVGDANETWNLVADEFHIPTITANRTYKFNDPGTAYPRKIRVVRPRTADNFTATIQTGASVTLAVVSALASGWVDLTYNPAGGVGWVVSGYGGTLTSVSVNV